MNIDEVKAASHILEKIDQYDRVYDNVKERSVDFVSNGAVLPINRNQLPEKEITALQEHLRLAAKAWFINRRREFTEELIAIGIDLKESS